MNQPVQKFLLYCQNPIKCKIMTKLRDQKNVQITILVNHIIDQYFKIILNKFTLTQDFKKFIGQDAKQIYQYLGKEREKSIRFKSDELEKQIRDFQKEQSPEPKYVDWNSKQSKLEIDISLNTGKVVQIYLKLLAVKCPTQQAFLKISNQFKDFQNIQQTKLNIKSKQQIIKQLQLKLNQLTQQVKQQQTEISQINQQIQQQLQTQQDYQNQIRNIKREYQMRHAKQVKIEPKKQQNKGNQNGSKVDNQKKGSKVQQKSISKILPSASSIYEAMPASCQYHPLGKHIEFHNSKCTLFLKSKQIDDKDIHQMSGFDWSCIEILSLGGNKLTNLSMEYLSDCGDWPALTEVYLFSNNITDITKATFVKNVQKLSLYDLQLNQASCDFLIKTQFPNMKQLFLDFDKSVIQKCWQKIAASQLKNFPQLKQISIDNPELISAQTRVKLNKTCQTKNIKLTLGNPSRQCEIY